MASRKEQKERLRQERLEREQAQAAAAGRRKRMGYAVAGVLVAAVVVALAVVALAGGGSGTSGGSTSSAGWPTSGISVPARKETDLSVAAKTAGCVLQHPPSQGRGHTTSHVNYKTQPPTSGSHNPVWAHDGAYLKNPGEEHLVHALEHGRVIIWFKPNAPAKVRGALKKIFDEDKALMLLAPNARPMPYQVAATAWTQLLGCPTYNDKVPDALRAFRDAYRLKGPEYFPNAE
jgi:hypothetical protein